MDQSRLSFLIVSDDEIFIKLWRKEIKNLQLRVHFTLSYEEFIFCLSQEPYQVVLIDWQLITKKGLDIYTDLDRKYPYLWAVKILLLPLSFSREEADIFSREYPSLKGIKKNQSFSDMLSECQKLILSHFKSFSVPITSVTSFRLNFYSLLLNQELSDREFYKRLSLVPRFSGYDLIIIYSLLHSYKASGTLMVQQSGRVTAVHFAEGLICKVDAEDQKAWLARIKLEQSSTGLAIEEVDHKCFELLQATLLSLTLQSQPTTVAFTKNAEFIKDNKVMSIDSFYLALSIWVTAKVKNSWLHLFFLNWENNHFYQLPNYDEQHVIFESEIVKMAKPALQFLESPKSWSDLVIRAELPIEILQKAILLLVLAQQVGISHEKLSFNASQRKAQLNGLYQRIYLMNPDKLIHYLSELLQVDNQDFKEWISLYSEYLGSRPPSSYPELQSLWDHLWRVGEQAIHQFSDISRIHEQQNLIELKNFYLEQRVNNLLLQFDQMILSEQFSQAVAIVDELLQMGINIHGLSLMKIWTNLVTRSNLKNSDLWNTLSHEERFDISYFYLQGLQFYQLGDAKSAKVYFEKVLIIDPNYPFLTVTLKQELNLGRGLYSKFQTLVYKLIS